MHHLPAKSLGCTICLPKGCKMVPGWPKAHTLRPHLAFSHKARLFMTYVHVVHGWVWKWGQQVGRNANWPCLGGSSGGDDHQYHQIIQVGD